MNKPSQSLDDTMCLEKERHELSLEITAFRFLLLTSPVRCIQILFIHDELNVALQARAKQGFRTVIPIKGRGRGLRFDICCVG
jgi:hypothetical protein